MAALHWSVMLVQQLLPLPLVLLILLGLVPVLATCSRILSAEQCEANNPVEP